MEEEGVRKDPEEEEESESEASVIESEDEDKEEIPEDDNAATGPVSAFGNMNRHVHRSTFAAKAPKKKSTRAWGGFGQQEDEEEENENSDSCDLGKAGDKVSPFMVAIKRNWQGLSFLMLESGFDLSLAVLDCFKAGKLNYVYTLLLKKDDGSFYQMKNKLGQNIAHLFSQYSTTLQLNSPDLYTKIYNTVLKKGISFKLLDNHKRSCLHYAALSGNLTLVKALLEDGHSINTPDQSGDTPLSLLVKNNYHKLVEFVELGAKYKLDVNVQFDHKKTTHRLSTFITKEKIRSDIIPHLTLFKKHGGNLDLTDCSGYTPLIILVRENMEKEAIQVYTELKPSLAVKDLEGKNIIHHIVAPMKLGFYQNENLLNFFAKEKADLDCKDKYGHSPLYYAS